MERNKKLASVYYWKGDSLTKIITFVCTITMLMSFYLSDRNNSYHFQKSIACKQALQLKWNEVEI